LHKVICTSHGYFFFTTNRTEHYWYDSIKINSSEDRLPIDFCLKNQAHWWILFQ